MQEDSRWLWMQHKDRPSFHESVVWNEHLATLAEKITKIDSAHEKQEVLPRKHQQWVVGFAGMDMYTIILKKKSCGQRPLSFCPLSTSCLQKQSCTMYVAHTRTLNLPWRGGNGPPRRNSSFQRKPPPPRVQTDRGWWTSWSSHDQLFIHQQGAPACKTEKERICRKVRWK